MGFTSLHFAHMNIAGRLMLAVAAFTVMFSSLFLKNYRIYALFHKVQDGRKLSSSAPIKDSVLFMVLI